MYTTYLPGSCGTQKVLEPMELELGMVVTHYVDVGNITLFLYKRS